MKFPRAWRRLQFIPSAADPTCGAQQVSLHPKAYVILTTTAAVLVLQHTMRHIVPEDAVRYLSYLVCAVLSAQLKVRVPGIAGAVSVNFFFIMLAVIELDLPAVLTIACSSALGQMVWRAHKWPRPGPLVFSLASIVLASYGAYVVYHWPTLRMLDHILAVPLIASAGVFFLIDTLTRSGIVALTEGRSHGAYAMPGSDGRCSNTWWWRRWRVWCMPATSTPTGKLRSF